MENSFQTSFIPKKPIVSTKTDKEPKSLFRLITIVILAVSVLSVVTLFVYKMYLNNQEQVSAKSLRLTRDTFEKSTIDELELFDKRTASAKQILSKHLVFSPLFTALGEVTIPTIQYTSFTEQSTDKGAFSVSISGIAQDYRSIALQADMFAGAKGRYFNNVLFSNLVKDKDNNITFSLDFDVSPELLSYGRGVNLGDYSDTNTNTNININTNINTTPTINTTTPNSTTTFPQASGATTLPVNTGNGPQ